MDLLDYVTHNRHVPLPGQELPESARPRLEVSTGASETGEADTGLDLTFKTT